jgi:hypothetical protein
MLVPEESIATSSQSATVENCSLFISITEKDRIDISKEIKLTEVKYFGQTISLKILASGT